MVARIILLITFLWALPAWAQTDIGAYTISASGSPAPGPSDGTSPDGTILLVGSAGNLVTAAGTWTFSTTKANGGNLILLNGQSAGAGAGVKLEVANAGKMYTLNSSNQWWVWGGTAWSSSADPGPQSPPPPPPPPPPPSIGPPIIQAFVALPVTVAVTWTADKNTDSCTSPYFTGGRIGTGWLNLPAGTTQLTITCTGPGGSTSATTTLETK